MNPAAVVRTLFGLDLRSLALFRVALGATILLDLAIRSSDLAAHYSDLGVLSRQAALELSSRPWRFSLHMAVGETWQIAVLFVVQALVALLLIVGLQTRLMTILSWALLVSLQNRNPVLLNAGDTLLRLLLFWAMFLPLGARWSWDNRAAGGEPDAEEQQFLSISSFALTIQICLVYAFTVVLKTKDSWWNGDALFIALHCDLFATKIGLWLRDLGWPLKPLTYASIYWEMLGPVLLLIPFRNAFFRTIAVLGFAAFHLGIALAMNVGLFPLISIVGWLVLLPGGFWDCMARRFSGFTLPRTAAMLQKSEEFVTQLIPRRPVVLERSVLGGIVAAVVLVYIVAWNVRSVNFDRYVRYFPREWNPPGHALRIEQKWNMFAPGPVTNDGWYVVEGRMLNGTTVDVFRDGAPVSWEKPEFVLGEIPNRRWGKYLMRLRKKKFRKHRKHYAKYLVRQWNETHPTDQRLTQLTLYYMREKTTLDGPEEPRKVKLWRYRAG